MIYRVLLAKDGLQVTNIMDDSQLFDLIPAFALGVVDNDERIAIEQLLNRSESARQLLREYQTVTAGLAMTVIPREAPAGLTDKFMAQLAQLPPIATDTAIDSRQNDKIISQNFQKSAVRPLQRIARWQIITIAAALVALILIISVSSVLAPGPVATVDQTTVQEALIQSILANPTVQLASFVASDPQSASMIVTIYSIPNGSTAVLDNSDMPSLNTGHQYELWAIATNQAPTNVAVFNSPQSSISTPNTPVKQASKVLVSFPKPLSNYKTLAITIEPHGGSPAPTTKPILTLSVVP